MSLGVLTAGDLTSEQTRVVERRVDSRSLVIAAAGTGKTHTVVRRVEYLLDHEVSADEILVLSFSRAAVREVATRALASDGRSRFVSARTFDAWALDLLHHVYADEDWHEVPFDVRIRVATTALLEGHAEEYTARLRHVLLDEVQDLVGLRRELVKALLTRVNCGFTMVGDPAQAIYGFQARGSEAASDIFAWVRETYADLGELSLTHDFRARTQRPTTLVSCGEALRALSGDANDGIATQVRSEFANVTAVGRIEDILTGFEHFEGSCAILCRDNGQAMDVSAVLHAATVPHRLQCRAGEEANPRWLAPLFRQHGGLTVNRNSFAEHTGLSGQLQDVAWQSLVTVVSSSADRIDLARLRSLVMDRRLPRFAAAADDELVTVSSMHRAKGLEYDRVFLLPHRLRDNADQTEEARLLYMAMTRCRDDLYRLDPLPQVGGTYAGRCPNTGRWARFQFRPRGRRLGLAVEAADVSREFPPGTAVFAADPVELQEYLTNTVRPGDEVILTRAEQPATGDLAVPFYTVNHRDRAIGVVSQAFRRALARYMYARRAPAMDMIWPVSMTNCWIEDVEAVAGSIAFGRRAGLGEHGVWLAPRLIGLTWFHYESRRTESNDERV